MKIPMVKLEEKSPMATNQNKEVQNIAIIGGCGHVGLPLGIVLAEAPGFDVTLVDVNADAVKNVNSGKIHFVEQNGETALKKVIGKTLRATLEKNAIRNADYVVFVTGTPVDEHLNPRVNDLMEVVKQYLPYLNAKQTVVLRSTVFPGSTELVWKNLKRDLPGIRLAFCPERVAQGFAITEIHDLPQIISAFDSESEESAHALFSAVAKEVIRLTPAEAELAKLFANGWRYLHFAIANQFYMMTESHGVNFSRVYEALTYNYPRAKNFPRPGFTAGPCLFKDTMQLSAFHTNNFFLGHAGMLINEGMPNFVVNQLAQKMGTLEGKKIGLLGMAFKPNNDDTRESLSYKVKKVLEAKMATVLDTDVYQPSHKNLQSILKEADGFLLGVPHKEYIGLNLGDKPFIDCWGSWEERPDLKKSPLERTENPGKSRVRRAA